MHALFFAGGITALIASVILYSDYGFWHETYRADDLTVREEETFNPESPGESFASFMEEARRRFGTIGKAGSSFLEGKETYRASE